MIQPSVIAAISGTAQRPDIAVELETRHPFAYPVLIPIDISSPESPFRRLVESSGNLPRPFFPYAPLLRTRYDSRIELWLWGGNISLHNGERRSSIPIQQSFVQQSFVQQSLVQQSLVQQSLVQHNGWVAGADKSIFWRLIKLKELYRNHPRRKRLRTNSWVASEWAGGLMSPSQMILRLASSRCILRLTTRF